MSPSFVLSTNFMSNHFVLGSSLQLKMLNSVRLTPDPSQEPTRSLPSSHDFSLTISICDLQISASPWLWSAPVRGVWVTHLTPFHTPPQIACNSCMQRLVSLLCHNPTQQTAGQQTPSSTDQFFPFHVTRKKQSVELHYLYLKCLCKCMSTWRKCWCIVPQHKALPPAGVLGLVKVSERMGSSSSSEALLLSHNLMCKTNPFSHYLPWCSCMPSKTSERSCDMCGSLQKAFQPTVVCFVWFFSNHDSNIV